MKTWFFRCTAAHFVLTAFTGLLLYFRAGNGRPGLFSDGVKEWLVMIHNGEWISHTLFGIPFFSGIVLGGILAAMLTRFSLKSLRKSPPKSASLALPRSTA